MGVSVKKLAVVGGTFGAAVAMAVTANAGPYNFGGNCPSQGAWTQMALQQTQQIASAIRQLKDNPACKGITTVLGNLQSATAMLDTPQDQIQRESRLESLPGEMDALRRGVMDGDSVNTNATNMLLNRSLEAAAISSELSQNNPPSRQSDIARISNGLSNLFSRYAAPTQKGLDLVTQVMQVLPEYDECLIGQPRQAMAILGGTIKVAAAFSAAGEGVGDKLGNAITTLTQMMRDRRFTQVLRKLDETEFWFSISCLLESTAKNYCDAQNAQEIMQYSKDQYQEAMKRNLSHRKDASYDNPLEGYYLLVRELPVISAWLQKVQFGVTPKLSSDANFKNKIWDQVTDMTKSVNSLTGFFNEQMLFMRELTDVEAKKNHLINVLTSLVNKMSGGDDSSGSSQFFTTTVNPTLLPFYLIGRNTVPVECRVTEQRPIAQPWDQWMKTGADGNFIADFNDPDKLAMTIQTRMNEMVDAAAKKQSAYFRQRLVMDMPNLVNQTLTGQYMTVRKAFENVFNYLVRFENRLNQSDLDLVMIPSVRETKVKIQKFMASYDQLRALGEKLVKNPSPANNEALLKEVNQAAQVVLDTVFNEFNVLFQKDTFLTNRVTTFIEKDFSMRIRAGLNMTPYQQDLLIITQKNLLDKLTEVHGLNPTSAQLDLARAQVINKSNLNAIEQIFGDSIYRMIIEMKGVASGQGSAVVQKALDKRFKKERSFYRQMAWEMPPPLGGGLFQWLFAGKMARDSHPDLYDGRTIGSGINSTMDDKFGSFAQLQAMFCAQTLAFESRGEYADICRGTVLKSYYSAKDSHSSPLDLRYDNFINSATTPTKIRNNAVLTSKNICAVNTFTIKNLVQWLTDQDAEMYGEMTFR